MDERFRPLPDETDVFRLAEPGGGHLPAGRVLPDPAWLAPNGADREAAEQSGRAPGLSAWDAERTTVEQAQLLTDRPRSLAFAARVATLRQAARTQGLSLDVVRDPEARYRPEPGWDGHCLIEGLARPNGEPRGPYKVLRQTLIEHFRPHPR